MTIKPQVSWVNPCGGKRWRTNPDHSIEIEGEGTPSFPAEDARTKNLKKTYQNFSGAFHASAKRNGIPVSWLVALATKESGHLSSDPYKQATAKSPTGPEGVMQFASAAATGMGFDPSARTNPAASIEMAAKLILYLGRRQGAYELPAIASAYNEGGGSTGIRCSGSPPWVMRENPGSQYILDAIRYNNTAVALGYNKPRTLQTVAFAVAAAGATLLGYSLTMLIERR